MKHVSNLFKICPFIGLFIFSSCAIDSIDNGNLVAVEDIELEDQLTSLVGDLDYFILPNSDNLSQIPADPKNPLTEDKVLLGKLLFHETGIGVKPENETSKGTYSCASCHHAAAGFQSGMQQGIGDGGSGFGLKGEARTMLANYTEEMLDVQPIRSPTVLNSAYQRVMLWNGQFGATGPNIGTEANWTPDTPKATNNLGFEGVEIQAIAGLTVHRMDVIKNFCDSLGYTPLFDQAFPEIDEADRYSLQTAGLAIAAYERTLLANEANFQKWLKGDKNAMSVDEKKGAALFFGKAKCYECHTGPALNSEEFYALGMNDLTGAEVHGDVDEGTKKGRGGFTNNPNDDYKFKVPQLYNLKDVNFLGHGGTFSTVKEVILYKNQAQKQNYAVDDNQIADKFTPLDLSIDEMDQLTQFVENSLIDTNLSRYVPQSLPSDNCFPNADSQSMIDLGCGN